MSIYVEKEYSLRCRDCDFKMEALDLTVALSSAEDHLETDTTEHGLINWHHEVEIISVDVVRSRI